MAIYLVNHFISPSYSTEGVLGSFLALNYIFITETNFFGIGKSCIDFVLCYQTSFDCCSPVCPL